MCVSGWGLLHAGEQATWRGRELVRESVQRKERGREGGSEGVGVGVEHVGAHTACPETICVTLVWTCTYTVGLPYHSPLLVADTPLPYLHPSPLNTPCE